MAPPAWLYLLPFVLLGAFHYARFSTHTPDKVALRRRAQAAIRFKQQASAGRASPGARPAVAPRPAAQALSSEEATQIALDRGLARVQATAAAVATPIRGVVTAAELHASLAPDAIVWLTFSNAAYLHFAQNFYLSAAAVGRAAQLAVAALDPASLQSWARSACRC